MLYLGKCIITSTYKSNKPYSIIFSKYSELHEQSFTIIIRSTFGHAPTKKEINDAELSKMCNEILLSELQTMSLLPEALEIVDNHRKEIETASKNNEFFEYKIK